MSRNLICIWIQKYGQGAFDDDAQAANLIQEYEARIAALERLVGKQALELEFKAAPPLFVQTSPWWASAYISSMHDAEISPVLKLFLP